MFKLKSILKKNFVKKITFKIASQTATHATFVNTAPRPNNKALETVDLDYTFFGTVDKTQGTKPPLVALHGLIGSKKLWASFSEKINEKSGRKVLGIDVRNHGYSEHSSVHTYIHMAHDIKKLLEKLEIPKISVLGHSMGGRTAMTMALLWPDLISSVATIDILPLRLDPKIFGIMGLFDVMSSVKFKPGITMDEAIKLADVEIKKVTRDENIRNYLLGNLGQAENGNFKWLPNVPVLRESFTGEMTKFPQSLLHRKYHGPVLFIAGGASNFVRQSDMPEIKRLFPSGRITFIEGAGHWLHMQKPDAFLEVLSKFLNEN